MLAADIDEGFLVEVLRVDDRRIDVGEQLEFVGAADVVPVARRAVGDDLVPVRLADLSRLERLAHPMLRGHAADPLVGFDHRGLPGPLPRTRPISMRKASDPACGRATSSSHQVFWMTIFGNLAEKSSALWATNTAVLRAICL